MTWFPATAPDRGEFGCSALETVIVPRARDLGGFSVRRALPSAQRQMVGPFIFWDQMGPTVFGPGEGLDVRPHPHIGLATVTYLFEGEIVHRDSLGNALAIRPGALNLMTAGRGIVHSERTDAGVRGAANPLSGIQSWVALPRAHEDGEPAFAHHGADELPVVEGDGWRARVIAGHAFGAASPVRTPMDVLYADVVLDAGATLPIDADHEERAIYTVDGELEIASDRFGPGQLLVFRPGDRLAVRALSAARLMLLGGETMDGPRHIWWNFVHSDRGRIEQAKADWRARRFAPVPGEVDFIPLPER